MYPSNTLSRPLSLHFRSAVLTPAVVALLLSSLNASAQIYSKIQDFSGSAPSEKSYITSTTAASATNSGNAGYFTETFTQPGFGAFGSEDPNNSSIPNTIPVIFERQIFQKGSTNNVLTFDLGQKDGGNAGSGFSGANKVVLSVSLNGAAAVKALTIIGPPDTNNDRGPSFAIGFGGASTTTYASPQTVTMGLSTNGFPSLNAIGKYTITLPNFNVRTTADVTITITASKRSIVLIDNVSISSGSPLPIELTRFDATTKGQSVNVSWATASEKNNDHFDVQRSATGEDFATIGTVKGQGNSSNAHEYTFTDGHPLAGQTYYRLRQVDIDGSTSYSPVVAVQRSSVAAAYPNPTAGSITLPASSDPIRYRVLNNVGQILLTGQGAGSEQLNISSLPRGTYFLELTSSTGSHTQRISRE